LTIIEGHAALLAAGQPPHSPSLRSLQEIHDAAERAGQLIRQLLMVSRQQDLQTRPVNMNAVIDSLTLAFRQNLGDEVRLQVTTAHTLPVIQADPLMMEQMLLNLMVNARDAMPQGGLLVLGTRIVTVTPGWAQRNVEARPGEFVCLTVSDTGCGMPPAALNHLFEPFFSTKEGGKSTGMGLATVHGIVKAHHGWIEVQSELGRGAVFSVYLPVAPQASKSARPRAARSALRKRPSRETVMVVEGEPAVRKLVTEALYWHGYHVLAAASGSEAIDVWSKEREPVDLLVTDTLMPGLTGAELAGELQRHNSFLKVIYTSPRGGLSTHQNPLGGEATQFLAKPYPPSKLAILVSQMLTGAPASASRHAPSPSLEAA
jgi:two-component system, cell cycle sensor histidine kinase and response regulator CckA